ncbi:MAG: ABC transporter permease [Acidobacteriota bacterium]
MLRNAWFIARKDLLYMLRQRETLLWTFLMPVLFFYFIGTITSGFGGAGSSQDKLAVWAPEGSGFLVDEVVERLQEQDYKVERPETEEEFLGYRRRLRLPSGLTDSVLAGQQVTVRLQHRGGGLGGDYDQIRVSRALYTVLADVVVVSEEGETPTAESIQKLRQAPRMLQLQVAPAGNRIKIPTGFSQAIPGTMVMFTLLIMLTSGAVLLVVERKEGLLRRLASTPISKTSVVLGKWSGRMVLGLIQIGFAMLAGALLFDMDWGPDLPMVSLVLISYAGLNACLGLLLGSLARTESQAIGIGVLSANLLAALGGCWWPIEITPGWMQTLSLLLPTGWAMDAMHKLVSFGAGASSAVPHLVVMILASVAIGATSVRLFRYQ